MSVLPRRFYLTLEGEGRNSRFRRMLTLPALFCVVAVPMVIGFAGPDIAAHRGGNVARSGQHVWSTLLTVGASSADEDDGPFTSYEQALRIVKREYYGEPITRKRSNDLTGAAIRGMLYSLNDPYTSYMNRDEWAAMQQINRGDFDGIGAELEPFGAVTQISRIIPDTPAAKIGLQKGDVITRVGVFSGKTAAPRWMQTKGMRVSDVVRIVKGPPGSRISLAVSRKGAPRELVFNVLRAHVEPPIVRYWMEDRDNKIGHILLAEFNEKSDDQLDRAWTALEKQGMRALVFDLRYNPGGLLDVAVDIGSRFIESGPVVIIQEKNGQQQRKNARSSLHKHRRIPLVVLVNENSASAAEIVAGAIKDNRSGILLGKHTFGKGMVQTLFPLDDGSALKLTTARYFTSMGNDISNKLDEERRPIFGTGGIKPDIEVAQSPLWEDQNFDDKARDAQLQKALDVLREKLGVVARK
jgi:carboxyl-terminal processing protease